MTKAFSEGKMLFDALTKKQLLILKTWIKDKKIQDVGVYFVVAERNCLYGVRTSEHQAWVICLAIIISRINLLKPVIAFW